MALRCNAENHAAAGLLWDLNMDYNEAETRFYLIDPVLRNKGYSEH